MNAASKSTHVSKSKKGWAGKYFTIALPASLAPQVENKVTKELELDVSRQRFTTKVGLVGKIVSLALQEDFEALKELLADHAPKNA